MPSKRPNMSLYFHKWLCPVIRVGFTMLYTPLNVLFNLITLNHDSWFNTFGLRWIWLMINKCQYALKQRPSLILYPRLREDSPWINPYPSQQDSHPHQICTSWWKSKWFPGENHVRKWWTNSFYYMFHHSPIHMPYKYIIGDYSQSPF